MHNLGHERLHLLELRLHLLEHQVSLVLPLLLLLRLQRLFPGRLLRLGLLGRLPRSLLSLSREPVLLGLIIRVRRGGGLGGVLLPLGRGGGFGDGRTRRLCGDDHGLGRDGGLAVGRRVGTGCGLIPVF